MIVMMITTTTMMRMDMIMMLTMVMNKYQNVNCRYVSFKHTSVAFFSHNCYQIYIE